jgi:hypothetical protein
MSHGTTQDKSGYPSDGITTWSPHGLRLTTGPGEMLGQRCSLHVPLAPLLHRTSRLAHVLLVGYLSGWHLLTTPPSPAMPPGWHQLSHTAAVLASAIMMSPTPCQEEVCPMVQPTSVFAPGVCTSRRQINCKLHRRVTPSLNHCRLDGPSLPLHTLAHHTMSTQQNCVFQCCVDSPLLLSKLQQPLQQCNPPLPPLPPPSPALPSRNHHILVQKGPCEFGHMKGPPVHVLHPSTLY